MPSWQFWWRTSGDTSEMGRDSARPHMAAITDAHGRIMVLMTHNTDISDSWEREGAESGVLLEFLARRLRRRLERRALRDDALR